MRLGGQVLRLGPAYQPIVYVTVVGAFVCSDGLKPPTSSYAKP